MHIRHAEGIWKAFTAAAADRITGKRFTARNPRISNRPTLHRRRPLPQLDSSPPCTKTIARREGHCKATTGADRLVQIMVGTGNTAGRIRGAIFLRHSSRAANTGSPCVTRPLLRLEIARRRQARPTSATSGPAHPHKAAAGRASGVTSPPTEAAQTAELRARDPTDGSSAAK